MTSRILPRAEWGKLLETEIAAAVKHFSDPVRVVVVEHDGQIVGCHALVPVLHAECLWIHPDHRKKASVARRLWSAVKDEAHTHFGAEWLMTAAASDDVRTLLAKVGAIKDQMDHYMVPLGGR